MNLKFCQAVSGPVGMRLRVAGVQIKPVCSGALFMTDKTVVNKVKSIATSAKWPAGIKPDILFFPEYTFQNYTQKIGMQVQELAEQTAISIGFGIANNLEDRTYFNSYKICHPGREPDFFLKRNAMLAGVSHDRPEVPGCYGIPDFKGFSLMLSICMDVIDEDVKIEILKRPAPDIFVVPLAVEGTGVEEYFRIVTGLLGTGNYLFVNDCGFYATGNLITGLSAFHRVDELGHSCFDLDHGEGVLVVDLFKQSKS